MLGGMDDPQDEPRSIAPEDDEQAEIASEAPDPARIDLSDFDGRDGTTDRDGTSESDGNSRVESAGERDHNQAIRSQL